MELLTNFQLLKSNKPSDCFLTDARLVSFIISLSAASDMFYRYSGTDYQGGKVAEGMAASVQDCQVGALQFNIFY